MEILGEYGEIMSAKVSINESHESRGYGYVWFKDSSAAQLAIDASVRGETPFRAEAYRSKKSTTSHTEERSQNLGGAAASHTFFSGSHRATPRRYNYYVDS